MTKHFVGKKKFSFMRLLLAVAIGFILVMIVTPPFWISYGPKKSSELGTTLNGIKLDQERYKLAHGTYLNCAVSPRTPAELDKKAVPWKDLGTGFTAIGFSTSGNVRFIYQVTATETGFVAEALGDTDGDGNRILFVATESTGPHIIGDPNYTAVDGSITLSLGTRADTED